MAVNRTEYWQRHVDFVAETFGDLVGGWQPVNEANIYPRLGYRGSGFPPGVDDRTSRLAATEGIQLATAEAAVRLKQTGAPVSSVFNLVGRDPARRHCRDGTDGRLVPCPRLGRLDRAVP